MRNPIILLLLLVSFFGCKETENLESATDVRIVSFSPGITQTLVDLGLSSKIVGRTAFCKSISKTIPVVGSYLDIDYERLLRLKPTHVLIQQIKTPKDKHLEHLSNREHFDLHYWKLDRVIDIQTMYSEASKLFLEEEKVLILDLDNTLWGGEIGDVGQEGIVLGRENGEGESYLEFQSYIKALNKNGVILSVCSKNEELLAESVFKNHPEMQIEYNDISCFIANFNDKATNIRKIKEFLNVGYDSMVFIDDNVVECKWVKKQIPEITVMLIPNKPMSVSGMEE